MCATARSILQRDQGRAREFLTLPASDEQLSDMVGRLFRHRKERGNKGSQGPQVIAITGASGGVGCTTLA